MSFKPFSVAIAKVGFHDKSGSKVRPVLLLKANDNLVFVFKITSQYANKSEFIRARYFEILDWLEAGLKKPSWIDTINVIRFNSAISHIKIIGELTNRDKKRLLAFINDN